MKKGGAGKEPIPNNLRAIRERLKLTLEQAAALVEPQTTFAQMQKLERGERELTHRWMKRIAKAYNCSECDLITNGAEIIVNGIDPEKLIQGANIINDAYQRVGIKTQHMVFLDTLLELYPVDAEFIEKMPEKLLRRMAGEKSS